MNLRKGFCCPQYQEAFEHGTLSLISVPCVRNPNKWKKICSFCGKDPQKYFGSRIYTKGRDRIIIQEKNNYNPTKEFQEFVEYCQCSNCTYHNNEIQKCINNKHGK